MPMPDTTSWLPKKWQGPVAALTAAGAIFLAGWVGYAQAQTWVQGTAKKTAQEEVAELKPLVREIHQDAKFNRCAMVAHINNRPNDLLNCDQMAAPAANAK